jgi:hypothetical protein
MEQSFWCEGDKGAHRESILVLFLNLLYCPCNEVSDTECSLIKQIPEVACVEAQEVFVGEHGGLR